MLGFHSISEAPISAEAYSRRELLGSISATASISSTFKEVDKLVGAVTLSTSITSTFSLVIVAPLEIEWHIDTEQDVASILITTYFPGIEGSVTYTSIPAATIDHLRDFNGSVSFNTIIASNYSYELRGSITFNELPAGSLKSKKYFNGQVSYTSSVTSSLKEQDKITSSLSLSASVTGTFEFRRKLEVTNTLAPSANLSLVLRPSLDIVWHIDTEQDVATIPVTTYYPGIENASVVLTATAQASIVNRRQFLGSTQFTSTIAGRPSYSLQTAVTYTSIPAFTLKVRKPLLGSINYSVTIASDLNLPIETGLTYTASIQGRFARGLKGSISAQAIPAYVAGKALLGNVVLQDTPNSIIKLPFEGSITYQQSVSSRFARQLRASCNLQLSINSGKKVVIDLAGFTVFTAVPDGNPASPIKPSVILNTIILGDIARGLRSSLTYTSTPSSRFKYSRVLQVTNTLASSAIFNRDLTLIGNINSSLVPAADYLIKLKGTTVASLTATSVLKKAQKFTGTTSFAKTVVAGFGFKSLADTTYVCTVNSKISTARKTDLTFVSTIDSQQDIVRAFTGQITKSLTVSSKFSTKVTLDVNYSLDISSKLSRSFEGSVSFTAKIAAPQFEPRLLDAIFSLSSSSSFKKIDYILFDSNALLLPFSSIKEADYFDSFVSTQLVAQSNLRKVDKLVGQNNFAVTIPSVNTKLKDYRSFTSDFKTSISSTFKVSNRLNGSISFSLLSNTLSKQILYFTGNVEGIEYSVSGFGFASNTNLTFAVSIDAILSRKYVGTSLFNLNIDSSPRTVDKNTLEISNTIVVNSVLKKSERVTTDIELNCTSFSNIKLGQKFAGSINSQTQVSSNFVLKQYLDGSVDCSALVDSSTGISRYLSSNFTQEVFGTIKYNSIFNSFVNFDLLPDTSSKQSRKFVGNVSCDSLQIAGFGFGSKTNLIFAEEILAKFGLERLGNIGFNFLLESNPYQVTELITSLESSAIVNSSLKEVDKLDSLIEDSITVAATIVRDWAIISDITVNATPESEFKYTQKLLGNVPAEEIATSIFGYSFLGDVDFTLVPSSVLNKVNELFGNIVFNTQVEFSAGAGVYGNTPCYLVPNATFYKRILDEGTRVVIIASGNKAVYIEMKQIIKNNSTVQTIKNNISPIKVSGVTSGSKVVFAPTKIQVVTKGVPGPTGPAGPAGEDEMPYAKRIDFESSDTVIYQGWADPGATDAQSSWRISKTTFVNDQGDTVVQWADGNANFDNIWNNRLSLSYS